MDERIREVWAQLPQTNDPREFLAAIMQNPAIDLSLRIEAAKALMESDDKSDDEV